MNKTQLYATMLVLSCGGALFAAANPASVASGPWRSLLQDHSAPDWRGWKEPGLPAGWRIAGGVLSKEGPVDDLVTKESFGNFELELDWKIGKGGNSGIFYRGTRDYDHVYRSGPEYQLLDDANAPDGKSRLTAAAAAFALYGAPAGVVLPFDHWNKTRLVVKGTHVEHWLNGHKVVEYELQSADWNKRVAASKFAAYPNYGLATTGLIGLQGDHPGTLSIRRIRVRELP
jgi:Domain of Unknown Function (DUF1080)